MEEIYINILERIAAEMPQLSLVDEDYGQLEMSQEEDHYPVTFPCALIGYADTDWTELTGNRQRGAVSLVVRLALDCYADSHYSSGTYEAVRQRHLLAKQLNKALRHFTPAPHASAMVRTHSREYSLAGGIKVFELTFSFRVSYSGADE